MANTITITYKLQPPEGVSISTPRSDKVIVNSDAYDSAGVREAQTKINEVLTAWKDAIGDREKAKEDPGVIAYGQGKASKMMQVPESDSEGDEED